MWDCACTLAYGINKMANNQNILPTDRQAFCECIIEMTKAVVKELGNDAEGNDEIATESQLYFKMEELCSDYLKENNIDEASVLNTIKKSHSQLSIQTTDHGYEFEIVTKGKKRIILCGSCDFKDTYKNKNLKAMAASFIATILFDKAFGEESDRNIIRNGLYDDGFEGLLKNVDPNYTS